MLDLSRQYEYLKSELDAAVVNVFTHGQFILGPEVTRLEEKFASLCTAGYACGVASGTDALLLALHATGITPGDEVITTDFSFFSTAGVITRLGATPVFVDIEENSYNLDANLVEAAITPKTRAIMPVHLFGQVADMDPIIGIAEKRGLKVIEDAAQAIGAEYKGRQAGSMGDFGCFSFYPTKNLGAGGDGGIIVTDDKNNYDLVRILRVHGADPKYYHRLIGYNSRLATIQAAVLLVKLSHLRQWSQQRMEYAKAYDEAFTGMEAITPPEVMHYTTVHIYNQYTIAVANREEVTARLREARIGFDIYYPVPFHEQECFSYLRCKPERFPVANRAAQRVLSLPIYPELTKAEQEQVIETVIRAVS